MFHIGQEVVCVRGSQTPNGYHRLIVNNIYIVRGINGCRCNTLLDVGFDIINHTFCYKCNFNLPEGIWWLYADRFVPLDEIGKEEISEMMKESEMEIK